MSVSTQICWKQAWGGEALSLLRGVAGSLGLAVKELGSQKWDAATATIGGIRDVALSYVGTGGEEWTFLHLPLNADFSDSFVINLSTAQPNVVVEFHEYHDTCWGYQLVQKGNVLDYFVNMPDVIEEEDTRRPCYTSLGTGMALTT